MNDGRTIFAQLMEYAPHHHFRRCVERYRGNARVRRFRCCDQFLCMAFGQLTYRDSLRDIEACLRAMQDKLYHAGFRARISRNTLAVANEKRDWRIYADFAQILIHQARQLYAELFFKWIKQHLQIKAFFGISANAVKTQIWIAISVYVLVAILKKRLASKHSLYTILQILSITLFEKIEISQALGGADYTSLRDGPANQLQLFDF